MIVLSMAEAGLRNRSETVITVYERGRKVALGRRRVQLTAREDVSALASVAVAGRERRAGAAVEVKDVEA